MIGRLAHLSKANVFKNSVYFSLTSFKTYVKMDWKDWLWKANLRMKLKDSFGEDSLQPIF